MTIKRLTAMKTIQLQTNTGNKNIYSESIEAAIDLCHKAIIAENKSNKGVAGYKPVRFSGAIDISARAESDRIVKDNEPFYKR